MTALKQSLKKLVFGLLGKDPEAVVVSFLSGEAPLARAMAEEVRRIVPDRRHFVVSVGPAPEGREAVPASLLRRAPPGSCTGSFAAPFAACASGRLPCCSLKMRRIVPCGWPRACSHPSKILAYNARLERHHLKLRSFVASWLFVRGVPLDRIFLRPWWLCPWKKDRSSIPSTHQVLEGRALSPRRPRVAVLSPYFPYPLSHGGAVRIFHLLREAARRFDIFLFAFTESGEPIEPGPVLEFCAQAILVPKPRYREPRWSSLAPPEVCEYRSPVMRRLLDEMRRQYSLELVQVEYTQLASYGGDVLVEHDVTFDLYRQVHAEKRSLSAWWDLARWRRFETRALRRYRRVVTMSEKDTGLLGISHARAIPNGVDLERFRPVPERPGRHLLFIGSFRHFPNVIAYRFFTEKVWPLVRDEFPDMTLTVVAGPDPLVFWRAAADSPAPAPDDRIQLLEFVRDVRPLYEQANLVLVPTLVSAGTNVKVLEAMAMERAVLSTSSGCAGLGLVHATSVWVADDPQSFADGLRRLISDAALRQSIARAARLHAERHFDWKQLGSAQRALWTELLGVATPVRPATRDDLGEIAAIQAASPEASAWEPESYLAGGCLVALAEGRVAGFLAFRQVAEGECEILNLAVAPRGAPEGLRDSAGRGVDRSAPRDAVSRSPVFQRRCPQPLHSSGLRRSGTTAWLLQRPP